MTWLCLCTAERVDGAGRLLAAAVKGIGNGLHSRAAALLQCLLREDLLTPSHFKTQQVTSSQKRFPSEHFCISLCSACAVSPMALLWKSWGSVASHCSSHWYLSIAAGLGSRISTDKTVSESKCSSSDQRCIGAPAATLAARQEPSAVGLCPVRSSHQS